jgi:hypothetical protein
MMKKRFRALVLHVDKHQVTNEFWEVRAYIALGFHMIGPNGQRHLSPECVGPSEVAAWADDMIHELEAIKREARKTKWGNHPRFDRKKSN